MAPGWRFRKQWRFWNMQQMLVVACEWAPDLCRRKLRQWWLERQRFLTRPSTCRWSSHSGRGWGADGVDKVEEPRRNQTLSFFPSFCFLSHSASFPHFSQSCCLCILLTHSRSPLLSWTRYSRAEKWSLEIAVTVTPSIRSPLLSIPLALP